MTTDNNNSPGQHDAKLLLNFWQGAFLTTKQNNYDKQRILYQNA